MQKILFLFLLLTCSCKEARKESIAIQVNKWLNREIYFPQNVDFVSLGDESRNLLQEQWDYAIVSYADSVGCISCKLQLDSWKKLVEKKDEIFENKVSVLLFLSPSIRKDLIDLLKKYRFDYPICIDKDNNFSRLNNLSSDIAFQTFLINRNNKVLAIGNPIHNPKVKELYLKIIRGEKVGQEDKSKQVVTKVNVDKTSVSLGGFDWQEEQKATFTLKNAGDKLLVIQDVATSCGCTTVSYSKEPVQPGKEVALEVTYKAERPEHFAKTITVYCNAKDSPLTLRISGDAE